MNNILEIINETKNQFPNENSAFIKKKVFIKQNKIFKNEL